MVKYTAPSKSVSSATPCPYSSSNVSSHAYSHTGKLENSTGYTAGYNSQPNYSARWSPLDQSTITYNHAAIHQRDKYLFSLPPRESTSSFRLDPIEGTCPRCGRTVGNASYHRCS